MLTYQAERMPEQIRLKVGGVTPQQMGVYEEFARNIPGFQPLSERDTALFLPKPEPSLPPTPPVLPPSLLQQASQQSQLVSCYSVIIPLVLLSALFTLILFIITNREAIIFLLFSSYTAIFLSSRQIERERIEAAQNPKPRSKLGSLMPDVALVLFSSVRFLEVLNIETVLFFWVFTFLLSFMFYCANQIWLIKMEADRAMRIMDEAEALKREQRRVEKDELKRRRRQSKRRKTKEARP